MLEEEKTKVGGSCPLTLSSRLMIRPIAGGRIQGERQAAGGSGALFVALPMTIVGVLELDVELDHTGAR